jgi:hypothetical protein
VKKAELSAEADSENRRRKQDFVPAEDWQAKQ